METGRKTRLRRILRRKRIKRAIKAYGNYIAMCPVISIIAVNAERFWIWTNGSEKKNQRQQVKN